MTMKKFFSFLAFVSFFAVVSAQTVTLTFSGRDTSNQYVQLYRVVITNLTKGWQETIYWPDTILTMQNGTVINDVEMHGNGSLQLSQNTPNPFTGTTEVSLTVAEDGELMMDIVDVNGKTVGTHRMCPQPGTHQFSINLATAGTYVMTAYQNGQVSSIKMVCNEGGDGNKIEYQGNCRDALHASASQSPDAPKHTTTYPFNIGDQMEYVGYAIINGTEAESQRISQPQVGSQIVTLQFTETQYQLPIVTTNEVSNITPFSAVVGGTVIFDGDLTAFDKGVCYSVAAMPTVSDNCINVGQGTGSFSYNLTGLIGNTTYFVRAYATNSEVTVYGNEVVFTTLFATLPMVTTAGVSNITANASICGGNVINDGGAVVTGRGVCWSTSQNPTIADNHTADSSGIGGFTSNITGLTPGNIYYVRAYATNSQGTAYGDDLTFTANDGLSCHGTATVNDFDNNSYNTVQIGQQCWMKENLRTTHYSDGISIALGSSTSTTTAYRYYPHNSSSTVSTYGYLYNWKAVMGNFSSSSTNPSGVQGICPTGWHVPSDSEWTQLTNYVSDHPQYRCGGSSLNIASALASTTGWISSTDPCTVGFGQSTNNNATGFSAFPAGYYGGGSSFNFGYDADFWSATEEYSNYTYGLKLFQFRAIVGRNSYLKYLGFSVRCLRN